MGNYCMKNSNVIPDDGTAYRLTIKKPECQDESHHNFKTSAVQGRINIDKFFKVGSGVSETFSNTVSTMPNNSTPVTVISQDNFKRSSSAVSTTQITCYPDGSKYDGQTMSGIRQGRGRMEYSVGAVYEGEWKEDRHHGYGKYTSSDGYCYEGGWRQGMQWGKGKEVYEDGGTYEGQFVDGRKNGWGRLLMSNGTAYEGDFKDNMFHGFGKHVWPTQQYEGQWKHSQMHGKGICRWSDGRRYQGHYIKGKKQGYGQFYWPDGRCFKGNWRDGQWINGTIISANGTQKKVSKDKEGIPMKSDRIKEDNYTMNIVEVSSNE